MRRLQCHQGQTVLYSRELDISVITVTMAYTVFVWCLRTLKLFNECSYVYCLQMITCCFSFAPHATLSTGVLLLRM